MTRYVKFLVAAFMAAFAFAAYAGAASANYRADVQLHGGSVASAEVYCSSVSPNGPWGLTYSDGNGHAICYGPNHAHLYARAQGHTDACHYYWWSQTNDAYFSDGAGWGYDIANLYIINYTQEC